MFNYVLTNDSLTVILEGIPKVIVNDHPNYEEVKNVVIGNHTEIYSEKELIELIRPIEKLSKVISLDDSGFINNDYGEVFIKIDNYEIKLPQNLAIYVMEIFEEKGNLIPLYNFCKKLSDHSDESVFDEIFAFMKQNSFAINSNGNILAYKNVTGVFLDIYTKTMDNSPGSVVKMPRKAVKRDRTQTCEAGLHAAAYSYLKHYSWEKDGKCVLLEINPTNIISIPNDYNNAKIRCCEYTVLREVEQPEELKQKIVWSDEDFYIED